MLHPEILWYDTEDSIVVIVDHLDYMEEKIDITRESISITFKETNSEDNYNCELQLFDSINPEGYTVTKDNKISIECEKTDRKSWNKLTKTHNNMVKIDWKNWKEVECSQAIDIKPEELSSRIKNIIDGFEGSDSDCDSDCND